MAHNSDRYGPPGGGRHRWVDEPDTGPIVTGRHGDHDGDRLANQADPDFLDRDVERDELGGALLARSMIAAGAARGGLNGAVIRNALAAIGAVGKQIGTFDELATGATGALRQAPAGLTAPGAASFLATCAQESAYFRTTREYGSGQWYAPWIGRGFVQVTHESNYRKFGAWCRAHGLVTDPDVFVKNRAALEDYRYAWLTAVWYFEANRLWPYANRGDHRAVSQGVNGGPGRIGTSFTPHGWNERQAMYAAFLRAGDALLPGTGPSPAPVDDGRRRRQALLL